jgi:RNA polymerase sigma-70 factor, ECF subfamily
MHAPVPDEFELLLNATAAGDRVAFAELYRRAGPKLFGITRRLMRRRELAEDVLQEAFVRIWQKAYLFDPGRGEAMAWLVSLVRRCALDRLRQQRGQGVETAVLIEDAADEVVAVSLVPSSRDLERCLGELQTAQKRAILLSYVYGLTHDELAERLAAPLGTVKSWIRRGLLELKECLER